MRTISYRLGDLAKAIIDIGYVAENERTRVRIDAGDVFAEYPEAVATMTVQPPKGSAYPASVTRDGNIVIWDIMDSDLASRGQGEIQLTFTEGETVVKSCISRINVSRSIVGSGTAPEPVQDWVTNANETLADLEYKRDSGYFKGEPGDPGEPGEPGQPGQDGHTPVLTSSKSGKTTTIFSDGVQLAQIQDGEDGSGADIIDDTAGEGDTDKTWSADKIDEEFGSVKNAIQQMHAVPSGGSSGQVLGKASGTDYDLEWKTVPGGGTVDSSLSTSSENPVQNKVITKEINALKDSEAYTYTSITDGKYVKYADGSTPSLSGSKVIDFPVVENMKIKYSATIGTPDLRGLAYYDINGFYISGVQMLSTEQTITVPAKAVKCKATISNAEQIAIFSYNKTITDNVVSSASVDYVSELTGGEIITLSNGTRYNNATNNESSIDTYSGNFASAKASCEAGDQFVYSARYNGNSNYRVWAFYDSTGTKISDSGTIAETSEHKTITAPANAKTLYFDSMTNDGVTPFLCKGLYPAQLLESLTPSATNPFAKINDGAGLLSIFHTVGCIGDSLASGESAYKSGGTTGYIDQYPFSWGQCLARMTGNTYYNFSQGGLTTKTWLSSQFATDCFDGNHDCNAYFIGLGQNDKNVSMTVGTTADINLSDYTQNADTYCGNYGKIIQKLKELQPKAKIFCFTDPNPPMDDNNYNNAVKAVVQLFDNCYLIDLYAYRTRFIGSSFIGQNMRAGHYNATGYQEIAKMIATYVDWFIRQNVSEFTQVEFIGTNYEWTT